MSGTGGRCLRLSLTRWNRRWAMRRVLLTALILSPHSIVAYFEVARDRDLEWGLPVRADVE